MTLIASIDVGKTHTRLALIDPHTATEISSYSRDNHSIEAPLGLQLDIGAIERWLIDVLRRTPNRHDIAAIVPVAHGAAAVLIDADGRVLAAPDYEDPRFEELQREYERERDPFEQTYSPSLPRGLNLGRQLHYLQRRQPELFAKVQHVLPLPQYWAWRLSGVMASEVTSLGCHTDLWLPSWQRFSALAVRRGWSRLFPSRRFAGESLGPARGALADAADLPHSSRIVCGIHDSNASHLRYLLDRRDTSFAVISSGTWTVVMANRAPLDTLRPERDMLANVDAFASPVATARFMGGREYEGIARSSTVQPTVEAISRVIQADAMAFPSFALGGPFPSEKGRTINAEALHDEERVALATLYLALMCDLVLESLKAEGDVIIDGPLASNPVFPTLLACLRPDSNVLVDERPGTRAVITYLAGFPIHSTVGVKSIRPIALDALGAYRSHWLARLMRERTSSGIHFLPKYAL